jgi:hypothetical protein
LITILPNITVLQQLFVFLQIIIISFCLLFSGDAFSDDHNMEYKIKAAYLYNFTKFIYWPPKNTLTFDICLIGDDLFGDHIKLLEQKKVKEKTIRLFRYSDLSQSIQHCYIIYFTFSSTTKKIDSKNFDGILTIGELDFFIRAGGMILLLKKDNHIKFQINKQLIESNNLGISAKLLELADSIENNHE